MVEQSTVTSESMIALSLDTIGVACLVILSRLGSWTVAATNCLHGCLLSVTRDTDAHIYRGNGERR